MIKKGAALTLLLGLVVTVALSGCGLTALMDRAAGILSATPVIIVVTATPEPRTPAPTATPVVITERVVVTATPGPAAAAPSISEGRDAVEELIVGVYDQVGPSVVFITSQFYYYDYFFGQQTQSGSGSGFVIDAQGHIVTNNHVIEDADSVEVKLADGTTVSAEILGADPYNDLAVLKVDVSPEHLRPVPLGSSSDLRVGQRAIAIGNPLGLERSLSVGVISALGREIPSGDQNRMLYDVIQTDAAINQGNSGGPLLDSKGRVIGVNTSIPNVTGASIGIGFAVPVDTVKRVVPELIAKGKFAHSWIGVDGYSITPGLADLLDLPAQSGVLVMTVDRRGPAYKAGLLGPNQQTIIAGRRVPVGGDIIIAIDGRTLTTIDDMVKYLETQTKIGQQITLTILRDGQKQDIQVEVGELP